MGMTLLTPTMILLGSCGLNCHAAVWYCALFQIATLRLSSRKCWSARSTRSNALASGWTAMLLNRPRRRDRKALRVATLAQLILKRASSCRWLVAGALNRIRKPRLRSSLVSPLQSVAAVPFIFGQRAIVDQEGAIVNSKKSRRLHQMFI